MYTTIQLVLIGLLYIATSMLVKEEEYNERHYEI